jgi:hypothetical protein
MRTTIARWLVAGLLAGLCTFAQAAPPLGDGDSLAIRSVVKAQLQAMAAGDDEVAFSYAAPGLREQFGNAGTFMAMVRQGYPMVIRPTSMSFYLPAAVDDAVLQQVQLRDADGHGWLATYQLQRQGDGNWRISGCVVKPDTGSAGT